jgi:hypothetical protein
VSSILAAGSGGTTADGRMTTVVSHRSSVIVMAKILPIITETKRDRYATWRLKGLVRKLAVIRRRSEGTTEDRRRRTATVASHRSLVVFRGSIAQTVERRSHKSVAGGSIPPRATSIER